MRSSILGGLEQSLSGAMRKSVLLASRGPKPFTSPAPVSSLVPTPAANAKANAPDDAAKYFEVLWCKVSSKKHKSYDTGVLQINGNYVTVKNADGETISKSIQTPKAISSLTPGAEDIRLGGIEVQIEREGGAEAFQKESADKPKPQKPAPTAKNAKKRKIAKEKENDEEAPEVPPAPPQKTPLRQFVSPMRQKPGAPITVVPKKLVPLHSPDTEDALVLYRPNDVKPSQKPEVEVVVDPYVAVKLLPHQREGVKFMYECVMGLRDPEYTGCVLADEIYLGWIKESQRWLGTERLKPQYMRDGTKASLLAAIDHWTTSQLSPVLIISYEQFRIHTDSLQHMECDLLVLDEAHRIKNPNSQIAMALAAVRVQSRLLITGTPIQNNLEEFYAMFDFCNGGLLGSPATFRKEFAQPIHASRDAHSPEDLRQLGELKSKQLAELTGPFMLRRLASVMAQYLPPRVDVVAIVAPSALQAQLYQLVLRSKAVTALLEGAGGGGQNSLALITLLKKLCCSPALVHSHFCKGSPELTVDVAEAGAKLFGADFDPAVHSPNCASKLAFTERLLAGVLASSASDKVVVVSNYTQTLQLCERMCALREWAFYRLDGSTSTLQRQLITTEFNDPTSPNRILLLSSKAGGVGLNLIGASRLILFDPDWNPATDRQAMARIWRQGQRKEVVIYRLLTAGTLEEKMFQRQLNKQSLSNAVVDDRRERGKFSLEELRDIFSFRSGVQSDTHDVCGCQCNGTGQPVMGEQPTTKAVNRKRLHKRSESSASSTDQTPPAASELSHWQHFAQPTLFTEDAVFADLCVRDAEFAPLLSFLFVQKSQQALDVSETAEESDELDECLASEHEDKDQEEMDG